MSFVDITGTVDADTDGIVFEGKPGLERPIIPRFLVPKNLARKISSLTEGDALEIEKQRRSGDGNISFDETKLRSIIEKIGGDVNSLKPVDDTAETGMRSANASDGPDFQEPPIADVPEQFDGFWTPDEEQLRDLDKRSGRRTPPPPPANIGQKYVISRDDDGVYFAENISAEDVWSLRSGASKAPKRPFFAPRGGGNKPDNGEGYYFSTNGKRYWGKYGAAGALVRRKNSDGEYEYFLARRADGMSVGGGKWSFPGGAHKDKENSKLPGATAIEEFGEEVGGDISTLKPIHTYTDQVAPDWKYDTYVFEVGPDELNDLRSMDGESTDTGWFTASDIIQMAEDDKLLESFKRSAKEVFALSGDEVKGNKTTRKIKKTLKKISGEKVTSWQEKIKKYEPIEPEDYFDINNEMQSDFGISIGQVMQDEYDEGASIKEIAENWGISAHEVEKLLSENKKGGMSSTSVGQIMQDEYDEGASIKEIAENWDITTQEVEDFMSRPPSVGMSSAKTNRDSRGRDATPAKKKKLDSVIDFVIDKISPVTVIQAYIDFSDRRQEKKNPSLTAERLAREEKMKSGVDKAGKSGISIATKMALPEYKTLMEKVSLNGETVLASTSARTAEVQKLIDNLASKVDGDLDGMDFSKGNFSGIDFKNYSLRNASFFGSTLDKSNFSGCIIDSATFEDASLIDANLSKISQAWRIDFSGANLTNADLTKLNMHSALLNETNLEGAKLDGVNLIMADIRDMDFSNARSMRGVLLEEVQGEGANFGGLDMTNSSFVSANLTNTNFSNANLTRSDLRNAKLDKADFSGANMEGIELEKPGLSPSSMKETKFDNMPTKGEEGTPSGMSSLTRPYRDTSDEELKALYEKYLRYLGGPGDKGDSDFTYMRRSKEYDKIKKEIARREKDGKKPSKGMSSETKLPGNKEMPGLPDDELTSKLDDNVNSLNELETLLDDGEIDLAEYRKRQIPLRKEAAELGAEKKRRSGEKPKTGETGTLKREKVIDRGDGMIKRDERGNPSEWNGQKFLDGEAGKRRQAILELGFTEQEADTLLGQRPSPQKSGMGSRSSAKTKPTFSLTPLNLFIKRETTRTKGPVPELSGWSDRELADSLSMYDIRAPRAWDEERGSFIPSWFPSKDSLVREFDSRGYNVFLGTSGSRQYNDLMFSVLAKDNAIPQEMRRRIWKPSGLLTKAVRDGEEETGQVFPLKSRMKNWEFAAQAADMTDVEVRSLDVEFDNERANKLADVRSGIISKEQFNKWYEGELTPLRRALSAELTRRSLRKAVDGKQTIESVFGTGLTPREYAFLSKDPLLFTRAAGMMSRNGGSTIDKMVKNGEITQEDLEFIQQYHDLSDRLSVDLYDELTNLFGSNPDDVDWDSLDIDTKSKSRDIHAKWMRKYSASLSQLGDGQKRSRNELANMGFDDGEIDDIMTGSMSSGGMSSKRKSNKKITSKWSEEDRRAFTEQNLRSKKVPKKKKKGPVANEWTERRAGREIKSTTRASDSTYGDSAKTASYYESLANQYFSGIAEYVGEDTRIVNSNYNPNIPTMDEPFASIRTSTVGSLKDGDFLPDGFDAPSMFSTPTNPRYKVVYVSKDKDGQIVFGARDLQTGELLVKKMGVNEILPNVMRQSTNKRFGGMSSSRKVGDVKLHAKLADQFKFEQFDEIEKDLNGFIDEINSINEQLNIIWKNGQRRTDAGLPDSDFDEKRYGELEDMRSSLEDTVGEYVKFAEFVAQENIMRRRNKAAVKLAKEKVQNALKKQESPSGNPFEMNDIDTRRLFELGVTEADVADILDSFDIDDREMERVFTAGRPPFTGTKFAKQISSIIDSRSSLDGPEFEEFDPEDEDEQREISKLARRMINSAADDSARRSKITDRSKTMIDVGVSSSSSGGMSSKTPMGKGLGTSKVLYPTRPNKFIAKDVSFVFYDANREELSVGYKDKKKYVFGGITPEMVNDIENGKNSLIASLNAVKKDARYTINPDGTVMGSPPNTLKLLNRDKDRLELIGDDLEVVESVIDGLKNGQNDMTRKMRSDRRNQAMSMASGLAKNNEYAMAFNIMDALDEIDTRTNGAGYMPNGMRSYAATIHPRVQVGLSQDEVGEIRDEIRAIMRKHNGNFFIKDGLSKYDGNLAAAQKKEGRAQLVLLLPEYNAIMNSYEELAKIDPDWTSVVGPHPVELAGVSKDGRFDTEKFKQTGDFAGKLINNGAPSEITVAEQRELINWARRQPGFRIVQSIASSYDEKNGALTANQWRTLRSLHSNYGKNQYNRGGLESRRNSIGMRSTSSTDGPMPMNAVSGNTMGNFVPYGGPTEGGSRNAEVIPNVDIKGKSVEQVVPEGISDEEALALIESIGAYHPKANPDGIKGREYVERRTRLLDSIAETRRITERRAALERAQQSGQIGDDVNLPSHLEFWPLVSEDTKSRLNTAAQNKYGAQFIDLEPYQMEDVLVFETGASGYYSAGTFKQIKKRPNAIDMEDWERLLLPVHQRVSEIDEEEKIKREAARLEADNSPSLEDMLDDPNIAPERKARIEGILAMRRESERKWKESAQTSSAKRRSAAKKEIKLQKYETIDDVGRDSVKNIETMAKAKYGSKFDSLTPVQQKDVLDSYAKERFGVEHYRNIEQSVQKAQSMAERFSQQERIDGEHLAAWDSITDFFNSSEQPSFTGEKIDSLRELLDNYPIENENSTDAELLLSNKIEDISSLIDEMEMSYDDENITIPTGRTGGMASSKKFTPRGVEVERDESSSRIGGMSSLFNRNKPDKTETDTGTVKAPDKPSKPERKKPIVTDGWKKVGGQGGSNPGGFFEDENGVRHYVKTPRSLSHIESEVLAAELYKMLGLGVPQISQGSYQGKPNVVSTLISEPSRPITGAMGDGSKQWQAKVIEGFVADAWLANWDAVLNDNVRADKNGNPIRVDNGGSMKWRAQGGPKGAAWGNTVGEIDSLRGQSPAAPVYRQITDQQIKDQVAKLEAISPDTIKATVASIVSDPAEAKELTDTLLARRQDLINRFGKGRSAGMSSRTALKPMPEFGSQKFMESLPATLSDLSNEELMRMWDSTRPFVNLQQYEMGENAKNLNIRMEKIKTDIRKRIKSEVSLRNGAPESRSEKIGQGSAEAMARASVERKNRSEAIRNLLNNRSNAIKKYYSSTRMEDDQHTAIWDDIDAALMADGDTDITLSKLDSMIQLLDDYISSNKKDVSKNEQRRNVGQAEKMRISLAQLAEEYASDPYVKNGGEDLEKPKTPRINRNGAETQNPASENNNISSRISMAPTKTTAQYMSARKGEARAEGMRSSTGMASKTGRAEIRGEATFFKSIQDMLLYEAGKSDDSKASSALRTLHTIMTRQKSGLISDKRTNAGAIYLMQDELDNILDALFLSIDRQVGRDNADRAKLLSNFADMLAMAGMATFIDKSVPEVNSRTVKKFNSEGREVEIPLNE